MTTEYITCPACDGHGEIVINRSSIHPYGCRQDPQCEETFECHFCAGTGRVSSDVYWPEDAPYSFGPDYSPTDLRLAEIE